MIAFAVIERAQHDDHCWLTAAGGAWCIRRIARRPTGWRFDLWRGYEPHLEYATLAMSASWDMQAYAERAAKLLACEE
jgi:hypothetical protein